MLKYLLPLSPVRGPVGWMDRLFEAVTSSPAIVGAMKNVTTEKRATAVNTFLMAALLKSQMGETGWAIIL
jgi:hypothetical protein